MIAVSPWKYPFEYEEAEEAEAEFKQRLQGRRGAAELVQVSNGREIAFHVAWKSGVGSVLVFSAADGSMRPKHTPLQDVLRRALARAGLVNGYDHG